MRKVAAGLIIAGALAGGGTTVRLAGPGDADALAVAASAAAPRGSCALIFVTDPECPACKGALAELREVVRPGELGIAVRILEADRGGLPLLAAAGPGLLPLLLVTDASGRPVAVLRGSRPPGLVRTWLEEAASRASAMPLDRGAARASPWVVPVGRTARE